MEKIIVKSDALGVIDRIKAWNKKYEVYFNFINKKFMLYLFENELKPCTYCLTFPYDQIDERMIEYVQKSEIQNRKALLAEIEESNALLLKQEQKKLINQMENISDSKRNN
ncbi:MAG: hypothetical protein IJ318_02020 [Clostridia bacterium]|nr:hypothetical protein [Clostridia bacterium]